MELKTNLHFHTSDDPEDPIKYDFYQGINEAARLGFNVIALTCHNRFIDNPDYRAYAQTKGIFLIAGIEREVEKKHVVILNADPSAETIQTFDDLARYRNKHPEAFVLAPHPYFLTAYSLGKKLDNHLSLFDAIEYSWFYSKKIDLNKKAAAIAEKNNLPYIATSDTHELWLLDKNHAIIEADQKTPEAIFRAIREKKFKNVTFPARFWREMVPVFAIGEIRKRLASLQ